MEILSGVRRGLLHCMLSTSRWRIVAQNWLHRHEPAIGRHLTSPSSAVIVSNQQPFLSLHLQPFSALSSFLPQFSTYAYDLQPGLGVSQLSNALLFSDILPTIVNLTPMDYWKQLLNVNCTRYSC